jgi:hypothetical protein
MSKHKTFSLNEAGQFVTVNTVGADPGEPFVAVEVNENRPNRIVVTNAVGGMLMISTFVKDRAGLTISDVRFSDGSIFVEKAHISSRRFEGWRDEDLHFVRCSE